jgi:hypothetical protein
VSAAIHVSYRHFGLGDDGAARILDRANDSARIFLRPRREGKKHADYGKK